MTAETVNTFIRDWGAVIAAVWAVVTAVATLGLTVFQARATRTHNRHSVRPILKLGASFHIGNPAGGLRLANVGLGPAAITKTILTFDGKQLGEFSEANVNKVRSTIEKELSIWPHATTLGYGGTRFLSKDYQEYLLSVEPYSPQEHEAFRDLVRSRIQLEIHYDSLYGGENFKVIYRPSINPNDDDA